MLYLLENGGLKALVEVDRIQIGQPVKLIKNINGNFRDFWDLSNPHLYRKLTAEEKLELL